VNPTPKISEAEWEVMEIEKHPGKKLRKAVCAGFEMGASHV
jgi:hypothetical protein